ncbi:hypothetical protein F4803DRAFT_528913 [Xylaria telfairii]|nr:hypothetical protein F4803DRAFT_528913 [Xylaria telfairii]
MTPILHLFSSSRDTGTKMNTTPTVSEIENGGINPTSICRPDAYNDGSAGAPLPVPHNAVLTCGLGGLQVVWATIFSNGTSFMVSLGLPKSATALLWSVAPICGCFIQIYVGKLSDNCCHPWGRRRPFIVIGATGITISLLTLAWSDLLAMLITRLLRGYSTEDIIPGLAATIGVLSFCVLSVSIQPLQCGLRALILDTCSAEQQSAANIWAARFVGLGNILGCAVGSLDLPAFFSDITPKFRLLSVLAFLTVDITATITCLGTRERANTGKEVDRFSFLKITKDLFKTYISLSERSYKVLSIQFISWLGWFGFLFYSASYISELYANQRVARDEQGRDRPGADNIFGTFTNLLIAVITLITSISLPFVSRIMNEMRDERGAKKWQSDPFATAAIIWSFALATASILSFGTIFTSDPVVASALMSLMGIPWAVANWAPLTLFGIASLVVGADHQTRAEEQGNLSSNGTMIGLHTVAVSSPQIIAAGISTIVILLSQWLRNIDSFGWVIRAGSVAYLVAGMLAFNLE